MLIGGEVQILVAADGIDEGVNVYGVVGNAFAVGKVGREVVHRFAQRKRLAVGVFHIAGALEGTVGVKRVGYAQIEPAALLVVFGAVKHIVQPRVLVVQHFRRPVVVLRPRFGVVRLEGDAAVFPVGKVAGTPRLNTVTFDDVAGAVGIEVTFFLAVVNVDDRRVGYLKFQLVEVVKVFVVVFVVYRVVVLVGKLACGFDNFRLTRRQHRHEGQRQHYCQRH